nr:hypothetical protein [uncultured Rhodopila sp.]
MSHAALWVDLPMMLALPEDAGLVLEVTWNERPLALRFSPGATDVLADSLAEWQARRKLAAASKAPA